MQFNIILYIITYIKKKIFFYILTFERSITYTNIHITGSLPSRHKRSNETYDYPL